MADVLRNPLWPATGPAGETCKTCAWRFTGGPGPAVSRCRRHNRERVQDDWVACPAWDGPLDCQKCGACCREAYHAVEVSKRDHFARRHPDKLEERDGRWVIQREGDRCACLVGKDGAYTCTVYKDRPKTCRDFEKGSANCVEARRRVGLTR